MLYKVSGTAEKTGYPSQETAHVAGVSAKNSPKNKRAFLGIQRNQYITHNTQRGYTRMIEHQNYYNPGKYEAKDVIRDWDLNFNLGNAVKYICRAGKKDPNKLVEDLEKAATYINFELEYLKNKSGAVKR